MLVPRYLQQVSIYFQTDISSPDNLSDVLMDSLTTISLNFESNLKFSFENISKIDEVKK